MKKRLFKILVFIILLLPCYVYAEDISYDNAQKIVKEVMQAWYMRGSYRQYNLAKGMFDNPYHPEDATSQDMGYTVCSEYSNDVYTEAFGIKSNSNTNTYRYNNFPRYTSAYCKQVKNYIDNNDCKTGQVKDKCNGEYAIYHEVADNTNDLYFYGDFNNDRPTIEELAAIVKPGDVISYSGGTGHTMIVYDVATHNNETDILVLNSSSVNQTESLLKTKIDPTDNTSSRLKYYNNEVQNNGIIDLNVNGSLMTKIGTVHTNWLSKDPQFVKDGKIKCAQSASECSISRIFYEDNNHNAIFNYKTDASQIKNSMVRTKLPGIFIHKTASSLDNNSVYPDQEITYTIKIANQSNVNKKDGGKNYSKFYVSEVIPTDDVEFVSASNNGQYSNGKITWTINSLNAEQNITLTYTVKVKNNDSVIGKKINAEGTVYVDNTGSITTGVVSNEVIRKPATKKDTYQNCYNKYKDSKKELDLINEVYKCAYDVDLKLNKFSLDGEDNNMFSKLIKQNLKSDGTKSGTITIVNNNDTKNYYDMILNDYWSRLALLNNTSNKLYYYLPSWSSAKRADTIYDNHFKDGDILIYYNDNENTKSELRFTKEQGIYAYIYLDGKFVGQNQTGDAVRNEFTYEYYPEETRKEKLIDADLTNEELTFVNYQTLFGKDYYVILRPEKIIETKNGDTVIPDTDKKESNSVDIEVPNTGKKESLYLILIGSLMVISGSVVLITKRKRVN